jgi:hypothetical protein
MRIAAFVMSIGLFSLGMTDAQSTLTDPDAYAVYNAIIPSDWLIRVAHAKELLIQDTTRPLDPVSKYCSLEGPDLIGPWAAAATNLKKENVEPRSLVRQFALHVPYRLIPKETLAGFFDSGGIYEWGAFHATYPDARGFLELSAVGFDEKHSHAIVRMSHSCGGLCGESSYHFLQRTPDGWKGANPRINSCTVVS